MIAGYANPSAKRVIAAIVAMVWLGFWLLYFHIGRQLAQTNVFAAGGFDVFFGADCPRVVQDLAVFDANHHRALLHPLFVCFLNPIGTAFAALTDSPTTAALILNSCVGGLAVGLCFYYFCVLGVDAITSLLVAGVFGFSTSQLVFSSIPETYAFAVCTIIASHLCVARRLGRRAVRLREWVTTGVLTLGVPTTNVIQTFICLVSSDWSEKPRRKYLLRRSALFAASTFVIVLGFNLFQRHYYPGARLFISPDVLEEKNFIDKEILEHPGVVFRETLRYMLIRNVIAPTSTFYERGRAQFPLVRLGEHSRLGNLTSLLWLVLLGGAVIASFSTRKFLTPVLLGGLGGLVFNMAFHNIWGTGEKFLFSGHYTFLLFIFLWPLCLRMLAFARSGLAILLILMMVNNGAFVGQIAGRLRGGAPANALSVEQARRPLPDLAT